MQANHRSSRTRRQGAARKLLQETRLTPDNFIMPIFIKENLAQKKEVASMPGIFQLTLNDLPEEIETISALGIPAVILFGIPEKKDAIGSQAFDDNGIVQQAIRSIRAINKDLLIIADLCFCEYTSHGHCGVLDGDYINVEKTRHYLGLQAVSLAKAGADWVAPSGMTDGMVSAIRMALDEANFSHVSILSYSAKYCSCLYNPFREAAEGAPQFGDRKSYQMNPGNAAEALREAAIDIAEGTDMIMVKPAGFYLDIIYRLKQKHPEIPLCAYQVSGEYAMLKAAVSQGMLQEKKVFYESLLSIKRAGADFIISYYAKNIAKILQENDLN